MTSTSSVPLLSLRAAPAQEEKTPPGQDCAAGFSFRISAAPVYFFA
jgi:hypothetical protein